MVVEAPMSLKLLWQGLKQALRQLWDWVIEAALVLWITRVSVVSMAIGAALFIFIPQVHDTFLEVKPSTATDKGNISFWLLFLISTVVFWALPVHYAARRDVDADPSYAGRPPTFLSTWIPRLLGFACILSVALGAHLAQAGLLSPPDSAFYKQANLQTQAIMWTAILLSFAVLIFLITRRKLFANISSRIGTWLMLGLTAMFFLLFLFDPVRFSHILWRAPLVPLLLGGWVPVFAWLAYKSRGYRVPIILILFLFFEGLAVFGDNHNVRRVSIDSHAAITKTEPHDGGFKRETIDDAINRWRVANFCSVDVSKCPRPIVVAASGGASRAGFFTAGVLGEMMDRSLKGGYEGAGNFRKQLFAISTVSGSSTGAAFFLAALNASDANGGRQPCEKDPEGLVYFDDTPKSWRQCMEQLLAGDFISPTLYGFVYKDALRGLASLGFHMHDRAEILERSWEERFCESTTGHACPRENKGMRAPFLSVTGHGGTADSQGKWLPILLLNGTDVETGRRVVVSPLDPKIGSDRRVFPEAYDLHDLLIDQTDNGQGVRDIWTPQRPSDLNRDVRLSTAALLSARFPVISPPGNILNAKDQILSRIIDGGYFENFGAATAADIVAQLKQAGLDPFVIEITNDPEFLLPNLVQPKSNTSVGDKPCGKLSSLDPLKLRIPAIVDAPDHLWFSGVTGPIGGLLGSRGAQGTRALRYLSDLGSDNFLHIYVSPLYVPNAWDGVCKVADVSMSWWLSKQVQSYLNGQIDRNCKAMNQAFLKIRKARDIMLAPPDELCSEGKD
jgi:hypothetical protein